MNIKNAIISCAVVLGCNQMLEAKQSEIALIMQQNNKPKNLHGSNTKESMSYKQIEIKLMEGLTKNIKIEVEDLRLLFSVDMNKDSLKNRLGKLFAINDKEIASLMHMSEGKNKTFEYQNKKYSLKVDDDSTLDIYSHEDIFKLASSLAVVLEKNQHKFPLMTKKIEELVYASKKIVQNKKNDPYKTFEGLSHIPELFIKHTADFIKLSEYAKWNVDSVFKCLTNPKIAVVFENHKQEFLRIAAAAENRTGETFQAFSNEKVTALFEKYPHEFVQIVEGAWCTPDCALKALAEENVAALFEKRINDFIKMAKVTPTGTGISFKEFASERGIFLHDEYGMECFHRFNPEILENAYKTATDEYFSEGKKIAFVVGTKCDFAAFNSLEDDLKPLLDKGYCFVLCEANNENEVVERYFNRGRSEGKESVLKERKYDLVVVAGHGNPWSVQFQGGKDEKTVLDLGDYDQSPRLEKDSWNNLLNDSAKVVLISCSTGGKVSMFRKPFIKNKGHFSNMMQMIGTLASKATVFAPKEDAEFGRFIFDTEGNVINVRYTCEKNSYSHDKKQK